MTRWVVVGGGTAGCLVAGILASDPANVVDLLEAGGGAGRSGSASTLDDLAQPDATWGGLEADDAGTLRPYVQGRGLGGATRVNGGVLSGEVPSDWPADAVARAEMGPLDRALLAAAPDSAPARLLRRDGRMLAVADTMPVGLGSHHNAAVRRGHPVRRVLFAGDRAAGVELASGDTVEADRVVLCAGAVFSPAILLRSGVVRPGLGELADHPAQVFDIEPRPGSDRDPGELVTGAVLRRDGIEVVPLDHVGRAWPGRAALLVGWLGGAQRGRIALDPDDPDGLPTVTFDALTPTDTAGLARAVALAEELLTSPPFASIVTSWAPAPTRGGYFHASGSCGIGRVVDATGAVIGRRGLYVADASVLELPASGTMGPTALLADRLSRSWLRE